MILINNLNQDSIATWIRRIIKIKNKLYANSKYWVWVLNHCEIKYKNGFTGDED